MKYLLIFTLLMESLLFSQSEIVNETSKPMLCSVNYQAKFEMEVIHGIEQRVQVQKQESFTKIILPNESILRKKDGTIVCYNELTKISSFSANNISKLNKRSLDSHIKNHELFDIGSYANEDKDFLESKYNVSNQCKEYKGGEYCKIRNGLDVLYTNSGRVKKIFIYGQPLYGTHGNLPFEADSINKIKANNEPLGLWVSQKNKEIFKSKPTLQSDNVIVWENPTKTIKRVVMTPKNGYMNINRYGNRDNERKLQDYLQAIEVEYILDDKAYEAHRKSHPVPMISPFSNNRQQYIHKESKKPKKANTTWGKQLNPKNEIPKNRFKAFYINTNNPKKVIAQEVINKVSINYAWDKFHNIKSEDFGGYWVGEFTYDTEKKVQINVSQSWSKTRIIIDGIVIYEGGNNSEIPFTFTKGKHKIEVEYVNNWHTTGFMVSITEKEKVYTQNELKKELEKVTSKNSRVVYVGTYESSKRDQSITLKMAKQSKPIVLVLNSYDSVEWIIKNPHKVKIEAIVHSAYKPGVEIKGDISKQTPVFAYKGRIGSYNMKKTCTCVNGGADFHCSGTNGLEVIKNIENITGKKMYGFSGKYGADTLIVPNVIIDSKKKEELKKEVEEVEKQREICQKKSNPDFENIFDK